MIKILYKSFLTLTLILISFSIYSQKLSEKQFEQRLNYERGNYPIQNYNQDFLNRPGYVWGIIKSKKDNLIYMAANGGVLEYDGVNVRRLEVKKDTTFIDYKKIAGMDDSKKTKARPARSPLRRKKKMKMKNGGIARGCGAVKRRKVTKYY